MLEFVKKHWIRAVVLVVAVGISATCLLVLLLSGGIETEIDGVKVNFRAYYLTSNPISRTYIDDITEYSIKLTTDFDDGTNVFGNEYPKIKAGKFNNDEFGDYMLYRYKSVDSVIVLTRKGGDYTVVFNLKTQEETERIFNELSQHILVD